LIVIDERAYVTMPEVAPELLFQIIAGRTERAAVMVTTNLPLSEWTTMFSNARLCSRLQREALFPVIPPCSRDHRKHSA
jgi:DNA replication protein DnaC